MSVFPRKRDITVIFDKVRDGSSAAVERCPVRVRLTPACGRHNIAAHPTDAASEAHQFSHKSGVARQVMRPIAVTRRCHEQHRKADAHAVIDR